MTTRAVAELAYRLAGILTIILAVRMIPQAASAFAWDVMVPEGSSFNRPLMLAGEVVPILILVSGGVFLILRSSALSRLSVSDTGVSAPQASPADLHAILFSTSGIVLVGLALPAIPRVVYSLVILSSTFMDRVPPDQKSGFTSSR